MLPRPVESLQNGAVYSGKTFTNWACQRSLSRLFQRKKEQSYLSRSPNHKVGESQGELEPHLGEKEGDQSESTERKGQTSQ